MFGRSEVCKATKNQRSLSNLPVPTNIQGKMKQKSILNTEIPCFFTFQITIPPLFLITLNVMLTAAPSPPSLPPFTVRVLHLLTPPTTVRTRFLGRPCHTHAKLLRIKWDMSHKFAKDRLACLGRCHKGGGSARLVPYKAACCVPWPARTGPLEHSRDTKTRTEAERCL